VIEWEKDVVIAEVGAQLEKILIKCIAQFVKEKELLIK